MTEQEMRALFFEVTGTLASTETPTYRGFKKGMELGIAAERKACAQLCEEVVTHPAGYGGQWEGYGPVKTQRDGKACAAAIRARSNAE